MGIEKMNCCGVLTAVYRDQGERAHAPDCEFLSFLQQWDELEDDRRLSERRY